MAEILDRAERTWSALAEIFGQTLLTNFGPEPPPLWRARIDELSDEQLATGLRELSRRDVAYAPTLGQFVSACRGDGLRRAPQLPSPWETGVDLSPLHGQLNLVLLRKLMRDHDTRPEHLRAAVRYKREVARQLDDAYPHGPRSDQDREDIRAMAPKIGSNLDRLLAGLST